MYVLQDFVDRIIKSDGVVCYGTGRRFAKLIDMFNALKLDNRIIYCIDKDPKKIDSKVSISGRDIDIYGKEKLLELKNTNKILIITNYMYTDVVDELYKEGLLADVEYFCFSHIYGLYQENLVLHKKISGYKKDTAKPVIPKVIHYCWFGHNKIPDRYKVWMKSWKKYCPDYEIIEWNESNYDIKKNQYMYEAYQCKKWGFVPDYARLDILYNYGGIYLDTDVELVSGLDNMLYQDAFAGFESEEQVNLGLGFGSKKNNSIIRDMRDDYDKKSFFNDDGTQNITPSPVIQTEFLKQRGLISNGEYQELDEINIYPEKVLCAKNVFSRRIIKCPETKSIHHFDASWVENGLREQGLIMEKDMIDYKGSTILK